MGEETRTLVERSEEELSGQPHQRVRRLAELGRNRTVTGTSRLHRVAARALAKLGAPGRTLDRSQ